MPEALAEREDLLGVEHPVVAVNRASTALLWIFIFVPPTPSAPQARTPSRSGPVGRLDSLDSNGRHGVQVDGDLQSRQRPCAPVRQERMPAAPAAMTIDAPSRARTSSAASAVANGGTRAWWSASMPAACPAPVDRREPTRDLAPVPGAAAARHAGRRGRCRPSTATLAPSRASRPSPFERRQHGRGGRGIRAVGVHQDRDPERAEEGLLDAVETGLAAATSDPPTKMAVRCRSAGPRVKSAPWTRSRTRLGRDPAVTEAGARRPHRWRRRASKTLGWGSVSSWIRMDGVLDIDPFQD